MQKTSVTGVILAGGKNSRMGGREKALLPVAGIPLIERILSILDDLFSQRLIVTNSPSLYTHLSVPTVSDHFRNRGPLGGLHSALSHIESQAAFVVACDMPFLNPELIQWLLEQREAADAMVPVVARRAEPLHAIYQRRCVSALEACLATDRLAMRDFLHKVNVKYVSEREFSHIEGSRLSFHNVNTPEKLSALSQRSNLAYR